MAVLADLVAKWIEDALNNFKFPAGQLIDQLNPGNIPPASGTDRGGVLLSDATPASLGAAAPGTSSAATRADHVHAHGNQAGGSLHAVATTSVAGFQSATDKAKEDAYPAISGLTPGHVLTATGASAVAFQVATGGSAITIEEVDGTPSESAPTKLIFPNGTLAVASHEVTYTPTGGGGGMTDPTTTLGDLIVNDGSGVDRLPVGSDGDVLTADSGEALGVKWATPTGGGGADAVTTGTVAAVIPGLTGDPDIAGSAGAGTSEEYDTSTTGLTWSPSTPNTVDSNTTILSHLYIKSTDGTERFGTKAWAPAGAFDARCKMSLGLRDTGNNADIGLIVGDSGLSNFALLQLNGNPGVPAYRVFAYSYAGGYTQRGSTWTLNSTEVYARITRDGSNNVSWWFSNDGKVWQLISTTSFTFTAAKLGWRISASGSITYDMAVDWLRTDV